MKIPSCSLALAMVLTGIPLLAQAGMSGSRNFTAVCREPLSLGSQAAASSGVTAEVGAGQLSTGFLSLSPSFAAEGGVAWGLFLPSPGPPVVFATELDAGTTDGSQIVEVIGFNFLADTASGHATSFCGLPGSSTTVHSNTVLETTTPTGISILGNPLGPCSVAVSNNLGFGLAQAAYLYLPGLIQTAPANIGGSIRLSLRTNGPVFHALAYSPSCSTGFAIPVSPLLGALELSPFSFVRVGEVNFSSGLAEFEEGLPDDTSLAGSCLDVQAAVFTDLSPLEGRFTNKVSVVLQLN